jgi:hypothetical protein
MLVGASGASPVGVDRAVAEIADQQIAAEAAEVGECVGDAPGRVRMPARRTPNISDRFTKMDLLIWMACSSPTTDARRGRFLPRRDGSA